MIVGLWTERYPALRGRCMSSRVSEIEWTTSWLGVQRRCHYTLTQRTRSPHTELE